VEIVVADTGGGLPRGLQEGQPFFSTKARGTGLGLLLTRRILARHDGALLLESRGGVGTRAVIRLPVAAA
jgi:two-component system NtrC family sensor kinase